MVLRFTILKVVKEVFLLQLVYIKLLDDFSTFIGLYMLLSYNLDENKCGENPMGLKGIFYEDVKLGL